MGVPFFGPLILETDPNSPVDSGLQDSPRSRLSHLRKHKVTAMEFIHGCPIHDSSTTLLSATVCISMRCVDPRCAARWGPLGLHSTGLPPQPIPRPSRLSPATPIHAPPPPALPALYAPRRGLSASVTIPTPSPWTDLARVEMASLALTLLRIHLPNSCKFLHFPTAFCGLPPFLLSVVQILTSMDACNCFAIRNSFMVLQ